jgi:hypothetical protein
MSTPIPDLWPADFGDAGAPSPADVLRQQATLLGQKTGNTVLGRVYTRMLDPDTFEHTFSLYAPLLGFERPILGVTHGLGYYPARLALDPVVVRDGNTSGAVLEAADADEFVAKLGDALKMEGTKATIRSLLGQSAGPAGR